MKQKSLTKLVDRYLNGIASPEENRLVETFLDDLRNSTVRELSPDEEVAKEALLFDGIQSRMNKRKGILVSMPKIWKIGAAAAVLIIVVSVWMLVNNRSTVTDQKPVAATKDIIAPEVSRAMITLADGSRIFPDSLSNGQLAVQENVKLVKLADGQIAYQNAINLVNYRPLLNLSTMI